MLADDQAVRDTMLVDALSALRAGAVHMCTSTISVALSKELAAAHAAHRQGYVAAPVLGRPEAAAAKQLWVMAAGPKDQIERCRPLMDAIGRGVSVMGEQPWQANLTKIAVNFMIASVLETLGESAALVRKAGMDVHAFLDVVNALFNSPVYANYGKIVADRRFEPAGFRLVLGLKDITLALDAAGGERVPLPLASLIRDRYLDAIAHGQGDADWSALSEVSARHAGIETA
jgi:3-hydroxyisobutyrate dehydrogenase-like beta-hydroxyacid dehydrogenase